MIIRSDTPIPKYAVMPWYVLTCSISMPAVVVYTLLYNRARLSQSNGWLLDDGSVYVYYRIVDLAHITHLSERTINKILAELEQAGLIQRIRQGQGKANIILVHIPNEEADTAYLDTHHLRNINAEIAHQNAPKLRRNNKDVNKKKISNKREAGVHALGRNHNVVLTDVQLNKLRYDYPDHASKYIDRLSCYMQSTGRRYADHDATIRMWIEEDLDRAQHPAVQDNQSYHLCPDDIKAIQQMMQPDLCTDDFEDDDFQQ